MANFTAVCDVCNAGEIKTPKHILSQENLFVEETAYKCASMLLSESEQIPENAVPILLVHGYATGVMGDIDQYFGNTPALLKAKGYTPYIFSWHTNSRFEDSANELGEAIKKIGGVTGKKVHVVAHSFGGLLTRTLLQGMAEKKEGSAMIINPEFASKVFSEKYIESVTTVGTPHSGIFDDDNESVDFGLGEEIFPYGREEVSVGLIGDHSGYSINGCAALTCHEAGEDYYGLGALGSNLDKELDFGVRVDPGHIVYKLAKTFATRYPKIPTKVLLGLTPDYAQCRESSFEKLSEKCSVWFSIERFSGDGLISLRGQRLLPSLSRDLLSTYNTFDSTNADIPIQEHLLGFTTDNWSPGSSDHLLPLIYEAMKDDTYTADGVLDPGITLLRSSPNEYSLVTYWHMGDEYDPDDIIQTNISGIRYKDPTLTEAGLQNCGLNDVGAVGDPRDLGSCKHATWNYVNYMIGEHPSQPVEALPKINANGKVSYTDASGAGFVVTEPTTINIYTEDGTQLGTTTTDSTGNFAVNVEFKANQKYRLSVIPPRSAQSKPVDVYKTTAATLGESVLNFSEVKLFSKVLGSGNLTVQLKDGSTGSTLLGYTLTVKTLGFPENTLVDHKEVNVFSDAVVSLPQGMYPVEITKTGYSGIGSGICIVLPIVGGTCDITMTPDGYVIGSGLSAVLNWGANPGDLDSHLLKYDVSGNPLCHTYYGNKSACGNEGQLDLDDVDGDGPETVKMQQVDVNSNYVYAIYHYSGSGSITSTSAAKVTVTLADGSSRTFNAPTSGEGRYWKVFEIRGGKLLPCQSGCIADSLSAPVAAVASDLPNQPMNTRWKADIEGALIPKQ